MHRNGQENSHTLVPKNTIVFNYANLAFNCCVGRGRNSFSIFERRKISTPSSYQLLLDIVEVNI